MDDRGGQDREVVAHRVEDEVGVVGGGEGVVLRERIARLSGSQLAAVGEDAREDFGMQRHDDVEDPLVAALRVAQPLQPRVRSRP